MAFHTVNTASKIVDGYRESLGKFIPLYSCNTSSSVYKNASHRGQCATLPFRPFFLSVNVFSTKVLIGDTIFTSPTGDGTAISTWSSETREGPAVCSVKAVSSFLSYFETLSIGPAPGIEPATSRSAVKRSTD